MISHTRGVDNFANRFYVPLKNAISKTCKILKMVCKILFGISCFALQPNLAVTVTVLSFCKPTIAEQIGAEMHKISELLTWKKVGYAALVLFLAGYALPVTQCMLTSYLAIQLGITFRNQLTQNEL